MYLDLGKGRIDKATAEDLPPSNTTCLILTSDMMVSPCLPIHCNTSKYQEMKEMSGGQKRMNDGGPALS